MEHFSNHSAFCWVVLFVGGDYAVLPKKIAESQNRSMTNMIETLVKEKIKEYEKENGEIELTDEEIIGEWTLHD